MFLSRLDKGRYAGKDVYGGVITTVPPPRKALCGEANPPKLQTVLWSLDGRARRNGKGVRGEGGVSLSPAAAVPGTIVSRRNYSAPIYL